jgi:hypothetical protein
VTTSDQSLGSRAVAYLTSRKHLAGTVGGLAGVGLALTGASGRLWPAVVAGLYGVGALAAPPDPSPRAHVEELLRHAAEQAGRLRRDLDTLGERVRAAGGDLPPGALDRFTRIEDRLAGTLGHPGALADPDVLHVLSTTIGKDLPSAVAGYLDLPAFQRRRVLPNGRTAGEELSRQLALLEEYVTSTADHVFSAHTRDIVDLTTYLERRAPAGELDLSDDPSD